MANKQKIFFLIIFAEFLSGLSGCVTRSGPSQDDGLKISNSPGPDALRVSPSNITSGHASYSANGKGYKVAWFLCQIKAPAATVLIAHGEDAGFESDQFCDLPEAQAFLAAGFHVAGFNRPGFGGSTGTRDLVGKLSQQAALVAAKETLHANPSLTSTFEGAYGFGTGAASAAIFGKQYGKLKWLVLGGGIYDFEQAGRNSSDGDLITLIKKSTEREGDVAYETRSIAYDVNGLPHRVAIFQGKDDTTAPADQAHAFRDGLAASEYKVTYQEIAGIGHKINPRQLRQILDVMVTSVR